MWTMVASGQNWSILPVTRSSKRAPTASSLGHLELDGLLRRYVVDAARQTLVDYSGLASPEATVVLERYLSTLRAVDPAKLGSDAERRAYWFNAYNASVLRAVVAAWGRDASYSVGDADFALFRQRGHRFAGLDLSLDEIEHGIIRADEGHGAWLGADGAARARFRELHAGLWGGDPPDPRLHMALNCASLSCPNLAPTAFRADVLTDQLDDLTRRFVSDPEKGAGPNGISALFTWYAADFARLEGGVEGFVGAHREDPSGVRFDTTLPYDWSLNLATVP